MIFDFWANANLKKFVGMPVAVYTGFSYLKDAETDDLAEEAANTSEWFIGAGYEFEGEAAMYVFYKEHDYDMSGVEKDKHVKFVGTLKF